ncbi:MULTISPECIES: response regulator transcription factor [Helicobacter]|uniref:response regulator transcription factor n=1 Tax=Helicobacter TaxID=209 RepID=UPI000DCF2845|nr:MULTISPECIES: response regulator transcription factor [Helicobacter]MCI2236631.1 response regulator transcription factor [Helicobacter sp. CaF467b]MCI7046748.1 response regulator transcription factor [Helicobacter sp.]MCI7765007.1 response regulator transcription factor [Helicobacter sp.]MCL9821993.1 response regulator transcription factor [Helicobacter colisuis]RAX52597.1 DNA-binding response regulator [Helicobacter sp. 11-8110]
MYQILIVEDDLDMQKLLVDYLKKSGMEAVATHSPNEALEMLKSKRNFDLAVLDIMLPEMDGLELCKKIREISDLPIIMSSARGDIGSKILGFERGADDYLAKSYEPIELVARINALLKRYSANQVIHYEDLEIDNNKHKVTLDGYSIDLTPAEFEILNLLISNKGKPYSRESLSQAISSIAPDSSLRSIDTHIRNLRAKLGDDAKEPKYIQSVWGIGYKFCD